MKEEMPDIHAPVEVNERFFGMLGLCRRAGKTVLGTEMICMQMREKRKPVLVLVAADVSENTRSKLTRKSIFYGIPAIWVNVGGEALADRLGKTGFLAAVAIMDRRFADEIGNACKRRESSDEGDGFCSGDRGAANGSTEDL